MKNLKKVLALVVVFTMMVSSVAFASVYPDVAADADYANAVEVLSSLGLIKGDDKGNFNPDATITRAEFATMVTRLLGVENAATGVADFTDVPATHWATGYIAMAQQQGIISGYGDGTFGPENPVKYEEAVKMLVCALGYEQMAVSKGGWVAGYITTAYQIGLLEDVNGSQGAGAPRSLVAQLCYNALDIPMMEQTGFGTDVKYEIMEKNDDHDKVTLLTKMGIYKLGGIVAANTKVAFKADATVTDKGYVEFWWDDDFDSPVSAWEKKVKNDPNYADSGIYYDAEILEVGATDIEDAIGNQLIIYVKKNTSKYEVLAYEIDDTSSSMVIKAEMLDDAALDFEGTPASFKYFKDEAANKSTKVSFDGGYTVVWNNVSKDAAYLTANLDSDKSATIELIDFNDNNKYDVVKVTAYTHAIVDEVIASRGYINDIDGNRINIDIDNEDAKVAITDVKGNALTIDDIAEGDVLAMVPSITSGATAQVALRNASYDSLDIIVLKDSFVTGKVSGYDSAEDIAVIADKEYDIAPIAYNYSKINLTAEGKFWIGIDGETIIGFEGDIAKSGSYAYIIGAYWNNNRDEADEIVTLELITKDGYGEYKIADSVKFVKPDGTYDKADADETIPANAGTVWAGEFDGTVGSALYSKFNNVDPVATADDTALRTVKVSMNSSNEITEITPVKATTKDDVSFNYIDVAEKIYNLDDQKLGTKFLNDGAIVIKVDYVDPENTKFTDVSYFVDESEYSALFLDVDTNGNYAAAVVYASEAVYTEGDSVAIVKSTIEAQNDEGDDIVKVVAVKDGEEVTLIFDEEELTGYGYGSDADYNDIEIGSVIMYTADAAGIVDEYDVVGTVAYAGGNKTFSFDGAFAAAAPKDFEKGDAYFLGYIAKNDGNKLQIVVEDAIVDDYSSSVDELANEDDETVTIDVLDLSLKGANQYTLTGTKKSNTKIEIGDYRSGNVAEMFLADDQDTDDVADDVYEVYYVFVRTFEGEVVDIVGIDVPTSNVAEVTPFAAVDVVPAPVEAPAAPVEDKAEVKEEIVELEGFDL